MIYFQRLLEEFLALAVQVEILAVKSFFVNWAKINNVRKENQLNVAQKRQ